MKVSNPLISVCFLFALGASNAFGADVKPDVLVRDVVAKIMHKVETDADIASGDMEKTIKFVEAQVAPHFDFPRMARLAVGRSWREATPKQRALIVQEFRTLLVRSYASAFTRFKGVKIQILPLRASEKPEWALVESLIKLPTAVAQPIALNYDMELIDGNWKVFDLQIDGASLIVNNRSLFQTEIQSSGIEGLIETLKQKNAQNVSTDSGAKR
ncbi:MAG: ABC transporter substrate-binding protein [Proteobacteria bacterium]|nr:ABC transporter substrate-binding protein [Pseudomonadota bacterium]MDA1332284.1 ABC transporter substrate-binding protein [Pseudomonadota bacterium]